MPAPTTSLVTVTRTGSDVRITCDKSLSREEWMHQLEHLGLADLEARFFDYIDNKDGTETVVIEVAS